MSLRAVTAIAGVAAVLCLAGCSSSDGGGPSAESTIRSTVGGATSTATPETPPRASSSANTTANDTDAVTVKKALLQQSDLPSGWVVAPHDSSNDDPASDQQINSALAQCTGTAKPPAESDNGEVHAGFGRGDNFVQSSAKPARDVQARTAFLRGIVGSSKGIPCTASVLRAAFLKKAPAGAKLDGVRANVSGRLIDGSNVLAATFELTGTLSVQGRQTTFDSTTVFFVGQRVEAELDVTFLGSSPTPGLIDDAVETIEKRVREA